MAVLALIDDFAFPNRVFHAGHGYENNDNIEKEKEKYTLQVINGISTEELNDNSSSEQDSLKKQASSTFLKEANRFPFIGITNYKVNNGLLIGNGVELLELIKQRLHRLKREMKDKYEIELICVDCFSNNELTVVYFANKLSSISYFTNETRMLQLKQLATNDNQEKVNKFLFWDNTSIVNKNSLNKEILFVLLIRKAMSFTLKLFYSLIYAE